MANLAERRVHLADNSAHIAASSFNRSKRRAVDVRNNVHFQAVREKTNSNRRESDGHMAISRGYVEPVFNFHRLNWTKVGLTGNLTGSDRLGQGGARDERRLSGIGCRPIGNILCAELAATTQNHGQGQNEVAHVSA